MIERTCPECGFDPTTVSTATLGPRIRAAAQAMADSTRAPSADTRPHPGVWSAVEYTAHVRDVCAVMQGRLALIVDHDDPLFPDWDQDAAAIDGDYAASTPREVAAEVMPAGEALARAAEAVPEAGWGRRGRRSNGSAFTAWTLCVYALHDLEHHVHDVSAR